MDKKIKIMLVDESNMLLAEETRLFRDHQYGFKGNAHQWAQEILRRIRHFSHEVSRA